MTYHNSDQSDDVLRRNILLTAFSQSPLRGKSRVHIAIGAPEDVSQFMYCLHPCGIEISMWSPPQPIPDTEEVVRVTFKARDKTSAVSPDREPHG